MSNEQLIIQLLLEYAIRMQVAGNILNRAQAENRDVTDEEVDNSEISRDAALLKAKQSIGGA